MRIGIDLGGTNIAAAAVENGGAITRRVSIPANAEGGAKAVTGGLAAVCENLLGGSSEPPLSIGIGVPGAVNSETGEVITTPNLPLSGVNIAHELQEKYNCPVYLGNDANCAALGEAIAGGAKGARNVIFITLGTGIGGGIIIGGRLYTGLGGAAGEIGHMVVIAGGRECGCGRRGCWESYASATGLARTASEIMRAHKDGALWKSCGGLPENVDGRAVFDAFRAGDKAARLAVEKYVEHLAIGIINLVNVFEPDMVCVGGGIANAWDCIAEPLREKIDSEKYTRFSKGTPQTEIVKAVLGNDAGIIGAAALGAF